MQVIIIGSGCGVPSLRRGSPGMLLKTDKENILFDTGAGTLRKLLEIDITYHDIDYIFYSHLHPDHTLDLVSFLFAMKYAGSPRRKDLHLIGPDGFRDFYDSLLEVYGNTIQPELYELYLKEIGEGEHKYSDWKLLTKRLPHTEVSLGYRIELGDKRITYSGDTEYCQNIVALARDVNLLILECSFPEEVKGHLSPSSAGRIAKESNCHKLVLTHLYPICDQSDILNQCRKEFEREVVVAEDLMRFEM
ncbi:MBL fold metallo-hydrolase [candidate division NPL-UPA2 bacterium]|nr:MBL fold metallo-hydrolase [candidate division NPL-UPA2 bacterium]